MIARKRQALDALLFRTACLLLETCLSYIEAAIVIDFKIRELLRNAKELLVNPIREVDTNPILHCDCCLGHRNSDENVNNG